MLASLQGGAFADVPYTMDQMQRYLKYARAIKPRVSTEAQEQLVSTQRQRARLAMAGGEAGSWQAFSHLAGQSINSNASSRHARLCRFGPLSCFRHKRVKAVTVI